MAIHLVCTCLYITIAKLSVWWKIYWVNIGKCYHQVMCFHCFVCQHIVKPKHNHVKFMAILSHFLELHFELRFWSPYYANEMLFCLWEYRNLLQMTHNYKMLSLEMPRVCNDMSFWDKSSALQQYVYTALFRWVVVHTCACNTNMHNGQNPIGILF